jgi:hypothetical protein
MEISATHSVIESLPDNFGDIALAAYHRFLGERPHSNYLKEEFANSAEFKALVKSHTKVH